MTRRPSGFARIVLVFTGLGICSACLAASLGVAQATPTANDGTVSLPIEFKAATSEKVSGLQFEIVFDPQQCAWQGLAAGPAATAANKMVSSNALTKGRYRVIIAGFNQTVVPDGTVATVKLKPSAAPPVLRLENAILSDPAGKAVNYVAASADSAAVPASAPAHRPACGCAGETAPTRRIERAGDIAVVLLVLGSLIATTVIAQRHRPPGAPKPDRSQCRSRANC